MNEVRGWKTVPVPLTDDMEVAFAEAWYAKQRCIDDVSMADAWQAACDVAPPAPQSPRTESLARQVDRLQSVISSVGAAREKLQSANNELLSLLKESLTIGDLGYYNVAMSPGYRQRVREAVEKHEPRPSAESGVVGENIEQLQMLINEERPGSEDIRGFLYDTIARIEAERDAALAELCTLQEQEPAVELTVDRQGSGSGDQLMTLSPEFARSLGDLLPGTEVALFTRPAPSRFKDGGLSRLTFPTMLRQMWSGTAVQQWIDEQGPLYAWPSLQRASFQTRVAPWLLECFGQEIASDCSERNHRFLEEALELIQACGATEDDAHQLVDYVFGRPVGDQSQEVGGVMVTLAALCQANGLRMHQSGEVELERISQPDVMARIREKQKSKPAIGPLPECIPPAGN